MAIIVQSGFEAIPGFVVLAVGALVFLSLRNKGKKRITIIEYQRGLRFTDGQVAGVLPPGSYQYSPGNETILTVDMRPQPILLERLAYRDVLNRQALISVATELLVADPLAAATRLKDQVNDSFAIARETLLGFLSSRAADFGSDSLAATAGEITATLNGELNRVGMKISPVEITETWAAALPAGSPVPSI